MPSKCLANYKSSISLNKLQSKNAWNITLHHHRGVIFSLTSNVFSTQESVNNNVWSCSLVRALNDPLELSRFVVEVAVPRAVMCKLRNGQVSAVWEQIFHTTDKISVLAPRKKHLRCIKSLFY